MRARTQAAIAETHASLEGKGYDVQVLRDPDEHQAFDAEIGRAGNSYPLSTILDPNYCALDGAHFIWTAVRSATGRPVASLASRLVAGDVIELIRTGRLWGDKKPVPIPSMDFVYAASSPAMMGRAAFGGGLYIHPDFRGRGLGRPVSLITLGSANLEFRPDWHFTLEYPDTRHRAIAAYGYREAFEIMKSALRPGVGRRDMWLVLRSGDIPFDVVHDHQRVGANAVRAEQR